VPLLAELLAKFKPHLLHRRRRAEVVRADALKNGDAQEIQEEKVAKLIINKIKSRVAREEQINK
jgi:hypothetical protein